VLPNLPGSVTLPADLPGGVAKAVILLYVVEMLLTIDLKRHVPRLVLALTLATIAGRPVQHRRLTTVRHTADSDSPPAQHRSLPCHPFVTHPSYIVVLKT